MPLFKAQLLLDHSLSAYFPEMIFTDSGIIVRLRRNVQLSSIAGAKKVESLADTHKNPKPTQKVSDFYTSEDRSMEP